MQLFRSEEHVTAWCRQRQREPGAVFGLDRMWALADAWYRDRLEPTFRRRSVREAEELFDSIGLTGEAWRLGGEAQAPQ
jgi:hypothetical protein